jgi:hypothetical protein
MPRVARDNGTGLEPVAIDRAGQNARGSLARSVHGQLDSTRIGSCEFFHELS